MKVLPPGSSTATTILDISSQVNSYDDRGLVGIGVDSDFANNRYLWLLYSYELPPLTPDACGPMVSRLSRVTVNPTNTVTAGDGDPRHLLVRRLPRALEHVDCIPADGTSHSIGTVLLGPRRHAVASARATRSTSTSSTRCALRTYDEQSFAGKIMHIDRNGNGLAGPPVLPGRRRT